jgi:prolyl oligopeptidase
VTETPPPVPAPPTTRRDAHTDILHGLEVADPYRWLEDPTNEDVRAWVQQQNAVSEGHLAALPHRRAFHDRLTRLWDHPRRGAPWRRGAHWFQLRNDGLQDQDVLWTARAERPDEAGADGSGPARDGGPAAPGDGSWRVLLDPNTWSADGTASLTGIAPTDDGALVAFARSDAGSDWMTWRVLDTSTGHVHDDEIRWAKFSRAAWLPDASGFVYGAYAPPDEGEEHAAANQEHRLHLHRLGDDPADDPVVYVRPDHPEWVYAPQVTHDGRWLVVEAWRGTHPICHVHVAPIEGAGDGAQDGERSGQATLGEVVPLLDAGDGFYETLGIVGDELLFTTDRDAPLGRIVAVALAARGADAAAPALREVVPEAEDRLEAAQLVGGASDADAAWLVCRRLRHATARLPVHDARTGALRHEIDLPGPGTVATVTGGRHDRAAHLTFETFTAPASVLRHDLVTAETSVVTAAAGPGDDHLRTEQVHVHHDGVAVPLFLVHRDDVGPDGAAPTLLWGYGGFDIAVTPMYRAAWRAWVDAGGVLAVACLRGGGEYGRSWHDGGRLANKQHVFDDALACAAWLTGRRRGEVSATPLTDGTDPAAVWTAPPHLGIEGRSNGGLLVGACLTQEPTAFGSAVPEVGVLDLTRFHRFTIGWAWTSDYGDPDDADDLAVLLRYSPYHQVQQGTAYPPTLITTGDTDDRVVPLHSYKFAAALQHAQAADAPVLLRVDTSAGHGAGKPVGKLVEERADVLAFHANHLGLDGR